MAQSVNIDNLQSGTYVVAVSGGVDSVALLDILAKQKDLELVVAHFDHGIRAESRRDRSFVQNLAKNYGLQFEYSEAHLGNNASEDRARQARYKFLRQIRSQYNALSIVTAHHQDDVIETGLINLLRGTGWRGLASLRSTTEITRPFLGITKAEIRDYATSQKLGWSEDSTNTDEKYLRNYIRGTLLPYIRVLQPDFPEQLLAKIHAQWKLADQIDENIANLLAKYGILIGAEVKLPRYLLIMLPEIVALELMQTVFRKKTGNSVERKLARDALMFAKVARVHKVFELSHNWQLRATQKVLFVEPRTTVVS